MGKATFSEINDIFMKRVRKENNKKKSIIHGMK
jgi:hypothetical protein